MDKLKALLCLLEERLVEHDENRKEVQDKLKEIQAKIRGTLIHWRTRSARKSAGILKEEKSESSASSKSSTKGKVTWMPS